MNRLTRTAATILAASITVVSFVSAQAQTRAGRAGKNAQTPGAAAPARATSAGTGGIAGANIQPLTTVRVANMGVASSRPIYVTHAPGDPTRVFIIEKQGRIRVLKTNTSPPTLLATPFLDIDAITTGGTSQQSEQGLLGLAFHPDYQTNGAFYVYYTAIGGANTVARYQVSANPDVANPTAALVLSIPDSESNHNGGWIGFKPGDTDGYLYIATGDGGGGNDQHGTTGNGQNLTVVGGGTNVHALFGKILRIDIDGADNTPGNDDDDGVLGNGSTGGYTSPVGNPFVGAAGSDEIWAYGLRNPSRNSFDRLTGDMYIGDVGQNAWEEIDFLSSTSAGGENYGWRCMESNHCTGLTGCDCEIGCAGGPLTCPIHEYPNDAGTCAVTGGYVYRGTRLNELRGTYFFADYNCFAATSPIWSFRYSGGVVSEFTNRTAELTPPGLGIRTLTSFGEDYYGEVYLCDQEDGEVFKIVPKCPADLIFNNSVDVDDLIGVILAWGLCNPVPAACPADLVQNGSVDVDDLIFVILEWGLCPP
jgi:glucose/arabinose dehydrogenase